MVRAPARRSTPTVRLTACVRPAVAERLKKEAMESVSSATTAAMDAVNTGVATVWHNQQQLEAEARMLQKHAQEFNKQTTQVALPVPTLPTTSRRPSLCSPSHHQRCSPNTTLTVHMLRAF